MPQALMTTLTYLIPLTVLFIVARLISPVIVKHLRNKGYDASGPDFIRPYLIIVVVSFFLGLYSPSNQNTEKQAHQNSNQELAEHQRQYQRDLREKAKAEISDRTRQPRETSEERRARQEQSFNIYNRTQYSEKYD